MTNLRNRGWDIPGGHIDVGEVAEAAMIREVREETGVEVAPVRLVAYQRIHVTGVAPEKYTYPVPESYQVFFLAHPVRILGSMPNDESVEAKFWPVAEARHLHSKLRS